MKNWGKIGGKVPGTVTTDMTEDKQNRNNRNLKQKKTFRFWYSSSYVCYKCI